jgi:hypothetical protein
LRSFRNATQEKFKGVFMKNASALVSLFFLLTANGFAQGYPDEYEMDCFSSTRSATCELENKTDKTLRCELIIETWTTIGDYRSNRMRVRIAPGDVKDISIEADTNYNIKSVKGIGWCDK